MAYISKKLDPKEEPRALMAAKGNRVTHRLTFNPSSANPKETLYVDIPRLPDDTVLVPDTLALVAKVELGGASKHVNNRVVDNLGRCLIRRRIIKIGDKTLEDLERADLVGVFSDLWLPTEERANRIEQGIQTTAVNKIRSEAGDKGDVAADLAIAVAFPKYRLPLDLEFLRTHGALHTASLPPIRLELTLAAPEDVVRSSDPTKIGTYALKNIELVYQVIESPIMMHHVPSLVLYNHISHHKVLPLSKATTGIITDNIPVQLKSFVGVLFLFINPHSSGARESEVFQNPDVTKVEFDLFGVPNKLYPSGMLPADILETARAGAEWLVHPPAPLSVVTPTRFFHDKYGIFLDLRMARDHLVHGDGQAAIGPGKNLQFQIYRKTGGSGYGFCHVFLLGDAAFDLGSQVTYY